MLSRSEIEIQDLLSYTYVQLQLCLRQSVTTVTTPNKTHGRTLEHREKSRRNLGEISFYDDHFCFVRTGKQVVEMPSVRSHFNPFSTCSLR